jgi:hypothetical protein
MSEDANIVKLRPAAGNDAQAFLSLEAAICDLVRLAKIEEWLNDNEAKAELVTCVVERLADRVLDLKRRYCEAAKPLD